MTLALVACHEAHAPPASLDSGIVPITDAGEVADAAVDGGLPAPSVDAGSSRNNLPQPLRLSARALGPDGGIRDLRLDDPNEDISPEARFELELPALHDVRVRLFSEDQRAVPSVDRLELGPTTRYRLSPTDPLLPATRYTLRVDGLRADNPTDASGHAYLPAQVGLRTSGEKPPPVPKPEPKRKRAKSRRH